MFTNRLFLKFMSASRVLSVGLIVIVAIVVTTGFICLPMDHVSAPPSLRLLDWLWKVFICWCPI